MNQCDVFVIHNRSLYAHRVYKDPLRRELTFSKTINPDLLPDSGDGTVSFVVDWQLQFVDMQDFSREAARGTVTSLHRRNIENKNPDRESATKERSNERSAFVSYW